MKFFNTAGPTIPSDHYHIDPIDRVHWDELEMLIAQKRYFLLHAPRQTGKTSTLLAIMRKLNAEGIYACAYANVEGAQAARNKVERGIDAICSAIAGSISLYLEDDTVQEWFYANKDTLPTDDKLMQMLKQWTLHTPKPTILLIDEVDALIGDTLISLLRQIRAGYAQRPEAFPHSLVLCGVRDIRDYRIHTAGNEIITGGSAFNIKAASIRMDNFTYEECVTLWKQHTEATGQPIDDGVFPELWEDTKGQPWLVNALGHELVWKDVELRKDKTLPMTLERYKAARERLIQSRATHLDQLTDKLKEPRVHRVVAALLASDELGALGDVSSEDQSYVYDLGLITVRPKIAIANRIYQEVIPRELTWIPQTRILNEQEWYLTSDNRLDMNKLLEAFVQFFREHSDIWLKDMDYKEAGPQLLMQAFLQRIINGGGRINREYALGRKRTDLFIEWPVGDQGFFGEVQRIVIELKILHRSLESTIVEGIEQTKGYGAHVGADELHLVIFDRDLEKRWEEKIWRDARDGVVLWGC